MSEELPAITPVLEGVTLTDEGAQTDEQMTQNTAQSPKPAKRTPRPERRGKGRLSLIGVTRRGSVLAASVQDQIKSAEDKVSLLLENMKKEAEKGEDGDPEFCSWALSAMGELVAGNDNNRKQFMEGGSKATVLTFMSIWANDVYVVWQGCQAIAQLGAKEPFATQWGKEGLEMAVDCIGRSDVSELGATGCRTIKNLVSVDENMMIAKEMGVAATIKDLLGRLGQDDPQFLYRGNQLVKQIEDWAPKSEEQEEEDDDLPPWMKAGAAAAAAQRNS